MPRAVNMGFEGECPPQTQFSCGRNILNVPLVPQQLERLFAPDGGRGRQSAWPQVQASADIFSKTPSPES